ncbi:MAG: hypothetical protein KU29_12115 [Sulfurovum sp. FS06-10]|nr:MAG: hypothetical protein KU29_12115 [Sulfurovum sp. FS06-10]
MKQTTHATLLRFLARMPDELQIEVIENVFGYFYLLKEHNAQKLNRSERFHKSLLHILNEYHQRLSCSHACTWPPVRINTWPVEKVKNILNVF